MSHGKSARAPTVVECIIPILSVANVPASVQYYVDVLGFKLDWGHGEGSTMASVSRDGQAIMFCQGEQGHPGTWVWIGVEDIGPLFEQYSLNRVKFRQGPTSCPWAYEMQIEDPDGHVLRFGSEPRRDFPGSGAA